MNLVIEVGAQRSQREFSKNAFACSAALCGLCVLSCGHTFSGAMEHLT